jgi:hypothetical protein
MLTRRTLLLALLALVSTVVFSVLWNIDLGMGEPTLGALLASYLMWGRWADITTLVLFAALLIVAPLLPGSRRAGHVIVAGAAIALVGDLIDLSKHEDIAELARLGQLPTDFAAGRVVSFTIDATPTYTWAAGTILMGIGLLILSADAEDKTWRRVTVMLGIALGVMAFTDIDLFSTADIHWIASWITMAISLYWLLYALKVTANSGE